MEKYKTSLYIFGAGILGREFLSTYIGNNKYQFKAFIDNDKNKQNRLIDGLRVISLKDLSRSERNDIGMICINKYHSDEIIEQLKKSGFKEEQIFNFARYQLELNSNQYFDVIDFDQKQPIQFVDCGSLDGQTSLNALKRINNLTKIYAFDPDLENVKSCIRNLSKAKCESVIIEKAVWSKDETLHFNDEGNGMSKVSDIGRKIQATSLDNTLEKTKYLYIKMDIEGSEIQALYGSEKIIKECKPKLAICVYHKPIDIIAIPDLLLEYNSDYSFVLRHYSLTKNETVLYAY